MTGLSQALKINVSVAYLDGRSSDKVDFVEFHYSEIEDTEPLTLLYRYEGPGPETAGHA